MSNYERSKDTNESKLPDGYFHKNYVMEILIKDYGFKRTKASYFIESLNLGTVIEGYSCKKFSVNEVDFVIDKVRNRI